MSVSEAVPRVSASVRTRPIYVGGAWTSTADEVAVRPPATPDQPCAVTYHAGVEELERATLAALGAEAPLAALPAYGRGDALRAVSAGILERRDDLATQLAQEAGKPIKDATIEIERGALTFRTAAEECERAYG